MEKIKIESLSLIDLKELKLMIENRLRNKKSDVDRELGRNYDIYKVNEEKYHQDEDHNRLKRIVDRIEFYINSI
jgi:hypothetical protein